MISGAVVAGRPVVLACRRHLSDLERQGTAAFPYLFDVKRVEHMLAFWEQFLTLDDADINGRPLPYKLARWLQFFFGSLVGWVDVDGHLRFQEAYGETGKGSTKTPGAGGFGLYRLVGLNRHAVENYSLGVNADQANYLYGFAKRMCERNDDLRDLLEVGEYNLGWVDRNSFFRPLTSDGRSLDNKRVFTALIDELHEHPTAVIPEKMKLGIKSQVDALIVMFTNSGHDKTSVCWVKHDYALKVLEGTVQDEQFFAYVCQLDPCDECRAKGATQIDHACKQCDSWSDESKWPKVNPAIVDIPALVPYLRGVVKQAINQPSTLARILRLNFCIWTQGHSIWIPSDQWEACKSLEPRPDSGVPCAAAFDMSEKIDLSGCVVASRFDDAPPPPRIVAPTDDGVIIEIDEVEDGQKIKKIWKVNYRIRLRAFAWIPRDTMLERIENEHVPYDLWERLGNDWLMPTPGPVIDHHAIYNQFVTKIGPKYKPQRVGYDPHNATTMAVDLRDRAKYTVVEIGQGRKLSEYIKLFYALVRLGRIEHDGNPVFGWCIANAEPKEDRYENKWLEKPSATKRIDLAIAAVMAVSQVVGLPSPAKPRTGGAKIWTPGGFVNAPA